MSRQSSRIYLNGQDHKDVYFNGHYHIAGYHGSELVWEKIKIMKWVFMESNTTRKPDYIAYGNNVYVSAIGYFTNSSDTFFDLEKNNLLSGGSSTGFCHGVEFNGSKFLVMYYPGITDSPIVLYETEDGASLSQITQSYTISREDILQYHVTRDTFKPVYFTGNDNYFYLFNAKVINDAEWVPGMVSGYYTNFRSEDGVNWTETPSIYHNPDGIFFERNVLSYKNVGGTIYATDNIYWYYSTDFENFYYLRDTYAAEEIWDVGDIVGLPSDTTEYQCDFFRNHNDIVNSMNDLVYGYEFPDGPFYGGQSIFGADSEKYNVYTTPNGNSQYDLILTNKLGEVISIDTAVRSQAGGFIYYNDGTFYFIGTDIGEQGKRGVWYLTEV